MFYSMSPPARTPLRPSKTCHSICRAMAASTMGLGLTMWTTFFMLLQQRMPSLTWWLPAIHVKGTLVSNWACQTALLLLRTQTSAIETEHAARPANVHRRALPDFHQSNLLKAIMQLARMR